MTFSTTPSPAPGLSPEPEWRPDMLGSDFRNATIELGADPDGETDVVATVVRYSPDDATDAPSPDFSSRPALLWVSGMTDYFFHTEFAEHFHSSGYAVYAVDLRKCGRSHREGQTWHYITDLSLYFSDLTHALDVVTRTHSHVTPVAHSTGGLVAALWVDHLRREDPVRHGMLDCLVLNSPWLDLMYPQALVTIATPAIRFLGRLAPRLVLPRDGLGVYGKSIHLSGFGEWDFDTTFKPVNGHQKRLGWLKAIINGQRLVHTDQIDVGVDLLTLCSRTSWHSGTYSAATDTADAVLDVEQIRTWSPHLNRNRSQVTVQPIDGARHDVFLSLRHARTRAYDVLDGWLNRHRAH
jgi:Lysophospholipase